MTQVALVSFGVIVIMGVLCVVFLLQMLFCSNRFDWDKQKQGTLFLPDALVFEPL